jgi:hypothetical protein
MLGGSTAVGSFNLDLIIAYDDENLVFPQFHYEHTPDGPRTFSNNSIPGMRVAYTDKLQAAVHWSGIKVMRNDAEVSIPRLEFEAGHAEWVVFNPQASSLKLESIETNDPLGYWLSSQP